MPVEVFPVTPDPRRAGDRRFAQFVFSDDRSFESFQEYAPAILSLGWEFQRTAGGGTVATVSFADDTRPVDVHAEAGLLRFGDCPLGDPVAHDLLLMCEAAGLASQVHAASGDLYIGEAGAVAAVPEPAAAGTEEPDAADDLGLDADEMELLLRLYKVAARAAGEKPGVPRPEGVALWAGDEREQKAPWTEDDLTATRELMLRMHGEGRVEVDMWYYLTAGWDYASTRLRIAACEAMAPAAAVTALPVPSQGGAPIQVAVLAFATRKAHGDAHVKLRQGGILQLGPLATTLDGSCRASLSFRQSAVPVPSAVESGCIRFEIGLWDSQKTRALGSVAAALGWDSRWVTDEFGRGRLYVGDTAALDVLCAPPHPSPRAVAPPPAPVPRNAAASLWERLHHVARAANGYAPSRWRLGDAELRSMEEGVGDGTYAQHVARWSPQDWALANELLYAAREAGEVGAGRHAYLRAGLAHAYHHLLGVHFTDPWPASFALPPSLDLDASVRPYNQKAPERDPSAIPDPVEEPRAVAIAGAGVQRWLPSAGRAHARRPPLPARGNGSAGISFGGVAVKPLEVCDAPDRDLKGVYDAHGMAPKPSGRLPVMATDSPTQAGGALDGAPPRATRSGPSMG